MRSRENRTMPQGGRRRRPVAPRVAAAVALFAAIAAVIVLGTSSASPPAGLGEAASSESRKAEPPDRDRGQGERARSERRDAWPDIHWSHSRPRGTPSAGTLAHGVQLPREGRDYFSWDPVKRTSPNRSWRRNGTDGLVRMVVRVVRDYRAEHQGSARVAVGDMSRPRGGDFGTRYGPVGHASHQNGLDVDVYYPRRDERERAPDSVSDVDLRLAQDLVDRFVKAGAAQVFVGPNVALEGRPQVVQKIPNHDDHLHVRIPPAAG